MGKGQDLYKKAKKIIPGGTELLSKRPEMFLPELWPAYYKKAEGCELWDMDENKYTDMSFMGIGACVIGYADPDVNKKVIGAINNGSMSTLNSYEEVLLTEKMIELHPWAKMARYARTGGEAMAIAVRIARAKSGKDIVLFCGYHGWSDWYLAANLGTDSALDGHLMPGLSPAGVPRALKDTAFPFAYNDIAAFEKLISKYKGKIAAVVLEPIRNYYPENGFIEKIRQTTQEENIILIADEVSSGFRIALGGAHKELNFEPDIAVFSKALGNGFPIAAIIGCEEVMSAAQDSFISSTAWTERVGFTAALAMIEKFEKYNVHEHLQKMGKLVQDGWAKMAKKNDLKIKLSGIYPISHFDFDYEKPLVLKTLFTQLMLKRGFLATTACYASYAHKESDIEKYLKAVDESYSIIAKAIQEEKAESMLEGPVCHSGFFRLT